MKTPLALLAITVLSPIAATTVLTRGLIASSSALALSRIQRHAAQGSNNAAHPQGLRDELRLDACQDTLWTQAERSDLETSGALSGRLREEFEETLAQLRQPGAELDAVAQRMEGFKAEERAMRDENRRRWSAVHEALDAAQKAQAAHFFKDKLA